MRYIEFLMVSLCLMGIVSGRDIEQNPVNLPIASESDAVNPDEQQSPVTLLENQNQYWPLIQAYLKAYFAWILGGALFGAGVTGGVSRLSGGSVPKGAAAGAAMGGLAGYWLRKKIIENSSRTP